MPKAPVSIGPFIGGMNNVMDPSGIDDSQCARILNFDILDNGNLRQRPPVINWWRKHDEAYPPPPGAPQVPTACRILGFYTNMGTKELFVHYSAGRGAWAINEANPASSTYKVGKEFTAMVQYDNKAWIVSNDSGTTCQWWNPISGYQNVANMPKGVTAVVYKERMFIGDSEGRVRFSAPADFTDWPASNFFDISRGDGQTLHKLVVINNQIVAFKSESTYTFGYDASPTRAQVQPVSLTVGADSPECIAVKDNTIFVYHNGSLYAVSNFRWEKLNRYLRFEENMATFRATLAANDDWGPGEGPTPSRPNSFASVSIVGDRIVVRHGSRYFVYYMNLQAWSEWSIGGKYLSHFVEVPELDSRSIPRYLAPQYPELYFGNIFVFYDAFDSAVANGADLEDYETPYTCSVTTKMYDYEIPYNYKRLFWWGADVIAKVSLNALVQPVGSTARAAWGEVVALGKTWGQMKAENRTWSRPLAISLDVSDSAEIQYTPGVRGYVRYVKSLRFRKVSFTLSSEVTGTSDDSPLEIFSLMALLADKQVVPQKVT